VFGFGLFTAVVAPSQSARSQSDISPLKELADILLVIPFTVEPFEFTAQYGNGLPRRTLKTIGRFYFLAITTVPIFTQMDKISILPKQQRATLYQNHTGQI
jgi:hypothetical protein